LLLLKQELWQDKLRLLSYSEVEALCR